MLSHPAVRLINANNYYFHKISSFLLITSMLTGVAVSATAADNNTPVTQMPVVTVEGESGQQGYVTADPSLSKITSSVKDTPASITTVPKKLMDDQGVTTMRDALRNVPGISLAAGEGGAQGDNLTIRGFTARSDFYLDGMRDFGSYYRDPFNLESVEVLKGPDSLLFGRGSTGGVVNQVSKDPEHTNFNRGALAFGTDGTKRVTADLNHNAGDGVIVRLNAMGDDGGVAGRDGAHNSRYGFAPTVEVGAGTSTRYTLSYFHQSEDDIPDYGVPWFYGSPAAVDTKNFYGFKNGNADYLKTDVDIGTAKFEHDFNDNLTLRDQVRIANYDRNVRITEPKISSLPSPNTPPSAVTVTRNEITAKSTEQFFDNQTDLTSKFNTGQFRHTVVTGLELSHETSDPTRYTWSGVPTTNLANPNEDQLFSGTESVSSRVKASANTVAAYALDTMAITPKWDLIGGVRFDHVDSDYSQSVSPASSFSRTDDMLSWRGGTVYKPVPIGSFYVAVGTSFNPSIEQLSLSAANANVAPEKTLSYEAGTKWDLFDKKLSANFAVFRDDKTNARTPDPNNPLLNILSGEQRVQGFEVGLSGHITKKWQIFGGYAFMDSEVVKSTNLLEQGNPVANAPKHTFSLWNTYQLTSKLEVGGGMNAISSRNASTTPNATSHVMEVAPGYVTFDAMAKYPLTDNINMQLNITNLLNTDYYDQIHPSHIVPGAGRTALLTTSFSF
ncbi:MAG TPA: TonB-dependent siderophore receptor [Rickettsiales bacterium]|nr:TonB-dependent siderophore receptor [Rickettsiales bacterium]